MAWEPPLDYPFDLQPEQARGAFVFFSYAHQDKRCIDRLENHLSNLKYRGLITTWHDRKIGAGSWAQWCGLMAIFGGALYIFVMFVEVERSKLRAQASSSVPTITEELYKVQQERQLAQTHKGELVEL